MYDDHKQKYTFQNIMADENTNYRSSFGVLDASFRETRKLIVIDGAYNATLGLRVIMCVKEAMLWHCLSE